ncbi:phosphoenolpyruvate carboxykinase (ATP) [Mariprofundus sp. EBB-1]|uniref:phosphoenolpyruvate carboxykinase (ATP) n=1 Tax=Mariprofundus sp. EBB-1 TaxID=2650971 RepID=UPI000EF20BD0|nr:phosphoenolpyruvate carboxykinase (ATP) [Mariprofundus sp. EBB-1]RLL52685.1 phosphoenolpyruvate carboxykinase (ATP) [Mariprofundus sp. EBB-1]
MPYTSKQISEELALNHLGLKNLEDVFWNMPTPLFYEHALRNREGHLAHQGALVVRNGHFTGQSVKDKYIVGDSLNNFDDAHGDFDRSLSKSQFEALLNRVRGYLEGRQLYVEDCLVAAESEHQKSIRIITQDAWHGLFARTMFIRPSDLSQKTDFKEPEFTIIHVPHFHAVPGRDGTNAETFVIIDPSQRIALIGGTAYAGEIKNTVFAIMNHLLVKSDVLQLHAAVNVSDNGDATLFLGPDGSGKTALASDPSRSFLGDDMHGWNNEHIFNFEAGCYASIKQLDKDREPVIHAASQQFGSILENVGMDTQERRIDFTDTTLTENTRAAYPISALSNAASPPYTISSPTNLILLASDAFGILPAISRLTPEQLIYYYLLGYGSHPADNHETNAEPIATFSPCCGIPLMAMHPSVSAKVLGAKVRRGNVQCWLINTGWSGGPAGVGERMNIELTRTLITAALNGNLDDLSYQAHPVLGMQMPDQLDPIATWHDQENPKTYTTAAKQLAAKFKQAFARFTDHVPAEVTAAGPR